MTMSRALLWALLLPFSDSHVTSLQPLIADEAVCGHTKFVDLRRIQEKERHSSAHMCLWNMRECILHIEVCFSVIKWGLHRFLNLRNAFDPPSEV